MNSLISNGLLSKKNISGKQTDKQIVLYEYGNENTALTGGWAIGYTDFGASSYTLTKNTDNIQLANISTVDSHTGVATANAIDLSKYSALYVDFELVSYYGGANNYVQLELKASRTAADGTVMIGSILNSVSRQAFKFDLTGITQTLYLSFDVQHFGGTITGAITGKLYKITGVLK